ncbi:type I methionyl aminopeptidase [Patescibacteria group bacterium]
MIKTDQTATKIKNMSEGGKKLASIMNMLLKSMKVGTNFLDLEKQAVQLIEENGGEPSFKRVPNYSWATCLNVNEGIVHGVPKDYFIKDNDVISIDIGMFYKGFNTDMCYTKRIQSSYEPKKKDEIDIFLQTGKKALEQAKKQVKTGNRIGHISKAIEKTVTSKGYSPAKTLTGHGIGIGLHELPSIHCYLKGSIEDTQKIKTGMTLAIEVIYCLGKADLEINEKDGWTISSKDGKITAVFEETIAVTSDGCLVLTKLPC